MSVKFEERAISTPACASCVFWTRKPSEKSLGICRIRPPHPDILLRLPPSSTYDTVWPTTDGNNDWCASGVTRDGKTFYDLVSPRDYDQPSPSISSSNSGMSEEEGR